MVWIRPFGTQSKQLLTREIQIIAYCTEINCTAWWKRSLAVLFLNTVQCRGSYRTCVTWLYIIKRIARKKCSFKSRMIIGLYLEEFTEHHH